jgi:hypothetical protein
MNGFHSGKSAGLEIGSVCCLSTWKLLSVSLLVSDEGKRRMRMSRGLGGPVLVGPSGHSETSVRMSDLHAMHFGLVAVMPCYPIYSRVVVGPCLPSADIISLIPWQC